MRIVLDDNYEYMLIAGLAFRSHLEDLSSRRSLLRHETDLQFPPKQFLSCAIGNGYSYFIQLPDFGYSQAAFCLQCYIYREDLKTIYIISGTLHLCIFTYHIQPTEDCLGIYSLCLTTTTILLLSGYLGRMSRKLVFSLRRGSHLLKKAQVAYVSLPQHLCLPFLLGTGTCNSPNNTSIFMDGRRDQQTE